MPKYRKGSGSGYRRGKVWWITYYVDGEQVWQSSKSRDKNEARRLLAEKLGKAATGDLNVGADRVLLSELLDDVVADYEDNDSRSIKDLKRSVKVLKMFFGAEKAHSISTAEILKFRRMRIKKLENSSVNPELSALKRAFNLGIENDKIFRKPKIKMLQENNARQGFFEWVTSGGFRPNCRSI